MFYVGLGNLGNIAPSTIWIARDGGESIEVPDQGSLNVSPAWLPDSRQMLFVSNRDGPRDVYAIRVDGAGRPDGDPVRVTTGLNPHSISVSADGTIAAYSQFAYRRNVWAIEIPTSGSVSLAQAQRLTRGNQTVEAHDVSPDGEWVAFDSNIYGNQDIFIMPATGGEARRLTTNSSDDFHPSFSPDGGELVFHSTRHGTRDLFLIDVDGTNERRITDDPGAELNPEYAPNGLHIAFRDLGRGIYVVSRDAGSVDWGEPRLIDSVSSNVTWSRDSEALVYYGGGDLVAVSLNGERRVLLDGSSVGLTSGYSVWSGDGETLYFRGLANNGTSGLYALKVRGGSPRLVVRFDDPTKVPQFNVSFFGNTAYLSVTETESDIYVMDLEWN